MRERSRSLSLVYSGMYTGSMLGLAASPQMIASWGWASVFYIFGLAGVVWYFWWQRQAAASPQDDPAISEVGGWGGWLGWLWVGAPACPPDGVKESAHQPSALLAWR